MAQQTFAGVPAEFTPGEVLSSSDQNLIRSFMIAAIEEGMTGDTYGMFLPGVATMRYHGGGGYTSHVENVAGYIDAASSFWLGGSYQADT
jgi:hypothetical protein